MTARDVISACAEAVVRLEAVDGRLCVDGPETEVDRLLPVLQLHRDQLVEALREKTVVIDHDGAVFEREDAGIPATTFRAVNVSGEPPHIDAHPLLWRCHEGHVTVLAASNELWVAGRAHVIDELLPSLVFRRRELVEALSPLNEST
jgi:hypothetical protein